MYGKICPWALGKSLGSGIYFTVYSSSRPNTGTLFAQLSWANSEKSSILPAELGEYWKILPSWASNTEEMKFNINIFSNWYWSKYQHLVLFNHTHKIFFFYSKFFPQQVSKNNSFHLVLLFVNLLVGDITASSATLDAVVSCRTTHEGIKNYDAKIWQKVTMTIW